MIELPDLKDRDQDVLLLAKHFLQLFAKKYSRNAVTTISKDAEKRLLAYEWPGNVRELKNIIERCVVMEEMETLTLDVLPLDISGRLQTTAERRKSSTLSFLKEVWSWKTLKKN